MPGERRGTREVLLRFGVNVLDLLLGPRSLAINRAAIAAMPANPELGRILASKGRETTRPLVERFLVGEHAGGRLHAPDASEAFEVLMGLLVRDRQLRLLFGAGQAPTSRERRRRAEVAVDAFLRLHAV